VSYEPPPQQKEFNWIWTKWIYGLWAYIEESIVGDYALEVARGNINGVAGVNKFGANLTVGTSYEDIWLQGGTWTKLAAATTLKVTSSSANDTSAGTGAQTFYIEGLDANYLEISETVSMNGQTAVVTANTYLFVNRAYILTAGTGGVNAGDIYIVDDSDTHTSGVPDTASLIQVKISAGQGQTQQAIYTIPANKTAYLTTLYLVSGASKTVDFEMHVIDNVNNANRILFEGEESNSELQKAYNPYAAVPEKHTIIVDAKVDAGSAEISAGFDLYLVDN